jgi:hypothetical protein
MNEKHNIDPKLPVNFPPRKRELFAEPEGYFRELPDRVLFRVRTSPQKNTDTSSSSISIQTIYQFLQQPSFGLAFGIVLVGISVWAFGDFSNSIQPMSDSKQVIAARVEADQQAQATLQAIAQELPRGADLAPIIEETLAQDATLSDEELLLAATEPMAVNMAEPSSAEIEHYLLETASTDQLIEVL